MTQSTPPGWTALGVKYFSTLPTATLMAWYSTYDATRKYLPHAYHFCIRPIGVKDGGQGEAESRAHPKIREKYFSGNYYVKFGHFSDKKSSKFWEFC